MIHQASLPITTKFNAALGKHAGLRSYPFQIIWDFPNLLLWLIDCAPQDGLQACSILVIVLRFAGALLGSNQELASRVDLPRKYGQLYGSTPTFGVLDPMLVFRIVLAKELCRVCLLVSCHCLGNDLPAE